MSKDDYNMYFYGDKGDDVILSSSDQEGIFSGGAGDDKITLATSSDATDSAGDGVAHTVIGGAGVDTINVAGLAAGAGTTAALYAPSAKTTILKYSSFAEFFANGDIVDSLAFARW